MMYMSFEVVLLEHRQKNNSPLADHIDFLA